MEALCLVPKLLIKDPSCCIGGFSVLGLGQGEEQEIKAESLGLCWRGRGHGSSMTGQGNK